MAILGYMKPCLKTYINKLTNEIAFMFDLLTVMNTWKQNNLEEISFFGSWFQIIVN